MAITLNTFTACGDVMVPYLEDFESFTASSTTFPQCWTNFSNTSNYVQATYGVNSSNALHFAGPGVVVTPRIAIEGNRILLNCWLRAESTTSSGTMHIGFTTNPTTMLRLLKSNPTPPLLITVTSILTRLRATPVMSSSNRIPMQAPFTTGGLMR